MQASEEWHSREPTSKAEAAAGWAEAASLRRRAASERAGGDQEELLALPLANSMSQPQVSHWQSAAGCLLQGRGQRASKRGWPADQTSKQGYRASSRGLLTPGCPLPGCETFLAGRVGERRQFEAGSL